MKLYDKLREALRVVADPDYWEAGEDVEPVIAEVIRRMEQEARQGTERPLWFCSGCCHAGDPEVPTSEPECSGVWTYRPEECPSCSAGGISIIQVDENLMSFQRAAVWLAIARRNLHVMPFGEDP